MCITNLDGGGRPVFDSGGKLELGCSSKSTFTVYLGARPSCILKPALPAPVLLLELDKRCTNTCKQAGSNSFSHRFISRNQPFKVQSSVRSLSLFQNMRKIEVV